MHRNPRVVLIPIAALLVALLMAVVTVPAGAQAPGLQRKIVVFQERFGSVPAQAALVNAAGGLANKPLPLINAFAAALPRAAIANLLRRAEVLRVDDDVVVHASPATDVVIEGRPAPKPPPTPAPQTVCWGLAHVFFGEGYPYLTWDTSKGAGAKLAIVDTGIDLDHPDLQANIKGGVNTINSRRSADDDNGHGTHVAGIAAARDNAFGVVGVAPQASLYAVKVLDSQGTGFLSDIIEGLQWCVLNGIQVINMSLGASSDVQSFHDAVAAVYAAGIVEVAAAGNSDPGGPTQYPAAYYPEVISVSAVKYADSRDPHDDTITSWSCRGKVELAAPGDYIYSTYKGGIYRTMSGTSMASPHVAGVVALMLGMNPGQEPDDVKLVLQATALDLGDSGTDPLYGAGLVQAPAAVEWLSP